MRIGSLFSGIGGLELGLEWAGFGPVVWQCEIDEKCRQVLAKHWPDVKRYINVQEIERGIKSVDLICGGFPCQDLSSAGKGVGLKGSRSGLWYEFLRIVKEFRPEWVVVENVASGATRWVDFVRGDLEQQGYATFPVPLSAADCGAPHLRKRVFVVAHTSSTRLERPSWKGLSSKRRTSVKLTDGRAERKLQQKWQVEPDVGRVVNGFPGRVDRLKQLGNAVVPQCAQVVGEFIKILMGIK